MGSSPISGGNVLIGCRVIVCTHIAISNDLAGSALAFHQVFFFLLDVAAESMTKKREPLRGAGFTFLPRNKSGKNDRGQPELNR